MSDRDAIRRFFLDYGGETVGDTPAQPTLPGPDESGAESVELGVEHEPDRWAPITVPEAPSREGESPVRFIDGSHSCRPVMCLRSPAGWPVPLLMGEVGAVALRLSGRRFVREFAAVERLLSFVADPFPWEEVEAFTAAVMIDDRLRLRVARANMPDPATHSLFDYEAMRGQASQTCLSQMSVLERLALEVDRSVPTLVDRPLHRITAEPAAEAPLVIGVVKTHRADYLHDNGWRVLLRLRPAQRTPVFRVVGVAGGRESHFAVASWYLKLAGGGRLAPNWGFVRVDLAWRQLQRFAPDQSGLVNRLSRWLIDARCRQASYARMPVSLEPIVRAEEALKPLFTPTDILAQRLYRQAGLFGSSLA